MAAHLKVLLLITVVSAAIYANSLQNSFHFDDQHYIVANPYIRDISNIPSFFGSSSFSSFEKVFTSHYRPLLVTSYAINYAIGGLKPVGYHIVNLLFHVGSAFLVYLILGQMLGGRVSGVVGSGDGLSGWQIAGGKPPRDTTMAASLLGPLVPRQSLNVAKSQIASSAFGLLAMTGKTYGATALIAALIFAVHPFNSEVVNYITARSSVMCSFFYLLSFYCWMRFRIAGLYSRQIVGDKPSPRCVVDLAGDKPTRYGLTTRHSSLFYFASLLAFIAAMLTKEIAITLPFVLILYDLYFPRSSVPCHTELVSVSEEIPINIRRGNYRVLKQVQDDIITYSPFLLLVALPYLVFRFYVYGGVYRGIGISSGGMLNIFTNLLTQTQVLLKYMQLMIFPMGLTIEHDMGMTRTIIDTRFILPAAILLIIITAAYLLIKRGGEWRVISFFILWFFITLLPTTIIPLNSILQENRGYLAGIAFPIIAGIFIGKFPRRTSIAALLLLLTIFSIMTLQRNAVWKDEYSLWSDAVKKSPESARVHDNLGLAYLSKKEYGRAISAFQRTLELNPQYYLAYYNAGVAYHLQKKLDLAKSAYEKCLEINPRYFRAHYNLGIIYKKKGDLDMAIGAYERAISIDPRHAFVFNNLGVVLTEKGDREKAESVFKKATEIDPEFEKAHFNLGNLYFKDGRYELAAESYRSSLKIRPDYREAREMLNAALNPP